MKNKIVFIRSNPANPDVRIEKEAAALISTGKYSITILGWDRKKELNKVEEKEVGKIIRFQIASPYNSLLLLFTLPLWWMRVLIWLLKNDFEIVHNCDLDTFLPAYLAAKIKRKKIVYDIFDFYAYMLTKSIPNILKSILIFIERRCLSAADAVIIADNSRLSQLGKIKPKKIIELLNTPPKKLLEKLDDNILKKYFNDDLISAFKDKVIFSGLLGETRGLNQVLKLTSDFKETLFIFTGIGPMEDVIIKESKEKNNIIFLGSIPYLDNLSLAKKCSLMFTLYDPKIPNNILASPNKLFEAIMLQVPLLMNKEIKIKEMVVENNLGVVCEYNNYEDIKKSFKQVLRNEINYDSEKSEKLFEEKYNWEIMEKKLISLYDELVN